MAIKHTVSEAEKSEGDARLSGQRQKAEIMDLLEAYLNTIENVWDVPEQEKQQEMQRLKLSLKYELARSCPVPVFLSTMEKDDEEQAAREKASRVGEAADRSINLTPALKAKIAKIAARLNCSEDEAAAKILSDGVSEYMPKSLLGGESDDTDLDI